MRTELDTDPAPPRPAAVLAIVPVVAAVAAIARVLTPTIARLAVSMGVACGSAALIGIPMLFWALDHGRTRLAQLAVYGAIAGAVPLPLVLASGILGRLRVGGVSWAREVLAHGVPVPLVGLTPWRTFLWQDVGAILIGAASGAVYWAIFVRPASTRRP